MRARARARVRPRVYLCACALDVRVCACVCVRVCMRVHMPTKTPKNRPSQGKSTPHPSKKKSLPDRGPLRKTAIVPKHYNYLKTFSIFAPNVNNLNL